MLIVYVGEALSYNCIGVAFQRLGARDPRLYRAAIEYHNKHCEIADLPGKFIANVNLGIVHSALGENEKAAAYQQTALKLALQISSVAGQTIAIGNLGRIGGVGMVSDRGRLRAFVERYLALAGEMKHRKGEAEARIQLGRLEEESVRNPGMMTRRGSSGRARRISRGRDRSRGRPATKARRTRPRCAGAWPTRR